VRSSAFAVFELITSPILVVTPSFELADKIAAAAETLALDRPVTAVSRGRRPSCRDYCSTASCSSPDRIHSLSGAP
jgi:hypothetical protein